MNELLHKIDELQKQIDDLRPLDRETVVSLKNYYKIGLTWSSNALEGNTLTESETKVVIEDGLTIGGKPVKDHFEATGHGNAFEEMFTMVQKNNIIVRNIYTERHVFNVCIPRGEGKKYKRKNQNELK